MSLGIAIYLLIINVITIVIYGIDKLHSKKRPERRIPESTLLIIAAAGGSIGAWSGMYLWHHKTKHKKFKYGIPAIIIAQLSLTLYILI